MSKSTAYTKHRCVRCNRRLKRDRFVRSTYTGNRYCWPGEGCHR